MSRRLVKGTRFGLLLAAYPVIIYLLLSTRLAWPGALLVLGFFLWRLQQGDRGLYRALALLLVVLLLWRLFGIDTLLKMSPLFIHSSLFYLFAQSLRSTPLIERFARLDFGTQLPPGIADYCRRLTLLWAGFFAANIAGVMWLAIRGDDRSWMLYNGLIVYLLVGALLLGEYLWRRSAFPGLEFPPLAASIRSMIANGHKIREQARHDTA